jgi:hypothetical protein
MRRLALPALLVLSLASSAYAKDPVNGDDAKDATEEEPGLVLVNAASGLGDVGKIEKLRKVLDSRGLLQKLPRRLEAALDGRAVQITDVDAITEAYANQDYATALKIIEEDEGRILRSAAAGDPLPALAELSEWRGLIAAQKSNEDEAIDWFRTAYRFNPARQVDKKLASPTVRTMMKKARHETEAMGKLKVQADPDTAEVRIDGGKAQPTGTKLDLPIGMHLVTITADGRTSYSEMVEVKENKTETMPIALETESKDDRAAKLVDATVTAAPGKARLKQAKALSRVTGTKRYLMIEDGGDDHVTVRLYDVSMRKVSKPVDLLDGASSATIMRLVNAALDPENMVDATQVTVIQTERKQRWYERWYVWVGVGAVIGGGILGYEYMSREPTSVRGF